MFFRHHSQLTRIPDGYGSGAACERRHTEAARRAKQFLRQLPATADRVQTLHLGTVRNAGWIAKVADVRVDGFTLTLESNNARHALRRHGDGQAEARRGQVALDEDDIARFCAIIAEPDRIEPGNTGRRGAPTALFIKRMGKAEYVVVAELRCGVQQIAFKTILKRWHRNETEP